jgi:DeoR/GlpR family transcriptional regulator of sugar metabolism
MMDTNLSSFERQNRIVQILSERQRLSIAEVCETFSISEATARRDLETLDTDGKIQRVHGGAIALKAYPPEAPILLRREEHLAEKARIGRAAAALIQDGDTIFLGSGTTVLEVARHLREHKHLTVITNSLPVLNTLASQEAITVIGLGGILRDSELSFIGHIAEQTLAEVHADKVILGSRAISIEYGLMHEYLPETQTDRAILKAGRQIIVVADHSKFGHAATVLLAPLTVVHTIVTDEHAPDDFIKAASDLGVQFIFA